MTAWPAEVTHLMVQNILGGGAASSVLARTTGTELRAIDVDTLGLWRDCPLENTF